MGALGAGLPVLPVLMQVLVEATEAQPHPVDLHLPLCSACCRCIRCIKSNKNNPISMMTRQVDSFKVTGILSWLTHFPALCIEQVGG
jgi:hypothetical protein